MMFCPGKPNPKRRRLLGCDILKDTNGIVCAWAVVGQDGQLATGRSLNTLWRRFKATTYDFVIVSDLDQWGAAAYRQPYGFPASKLPLLREGGRILAWRWRRGKSPTGAFQRVLAISDHLGRSLPALETFAGWLQAPLPVPLAYSDIYTYQEEDRDRHIAEATIRAQALLDLGLELQEAYIALGGTLRVTCGSAAVDLYRRKYLGRFTWTRWNTPDETQEKYLRHAYYGGRCEVYGLGLHTGTIYHSDRSSAYGAAMYEARLPLPEPSWAITGLRRVRATWRRWPGVVEATVVVPESQRIPPLPYRRKDGRTIFPTGVFRGHWTTVELAYAEKQCGVIVTEIHSGMIWARSCRYLRSIATDLYRFRTSSNVRIANKLGKSLLTSLSGKWAQTSSATVTICPARQLEKPAKGAKIEWWPSHQKPLWALVTGTNDDLSPHVNIVWSAIITSVQRIDYHRRATEVLAAGGRVYSGDTDGLFASTPIARPGVGVNGLGAWTVQHTLSALDIKAQKVYKAYIQDGEIKTVMAGATQDEAEHAFLTGSIVRHSRHGFSSTIRHCEPMIAGKGDTLIIRAATDARKPVRQHDAEGGSVPYVLAPKAIHPTLEKYQKRLEKQAAELQKKRKRLLTMIAKSASMSS